MTDRSNFWNEAEDLRGYLTQKHLDRRPTEASLHALRVRLDRVPPVPTPAAVSLVSGSTDGVSEIDAADRVRWVLARLDQFVETGGADLLDAEIVEELGHAIRLSGRRSRRKAGKWDHVWQLIQEGGAETGKGVDQRIANKHNQLCAAKIADGRCERIDARKVAQIRYEYRNPDRHS